MNLILSIVLHTANILGIFNDPFEFEGDYGPEVNPTRHQVFELVVSREALATHLSDVEIKQQLENANASAKEIKDFKNFLVAQAIDHDKVHGPTLGQLVTPEIITEIQTHLLNLRDVEFVDADFTNILNFIERYKDQRVFRFFRNNPFELLGLDKILRDKAAREGKAFDLPILGSSKSLEGSDSFELKRNLIKDVFTKETFALTKSQHIIKQALQKLDSNYSKEFLGESADNRDLEVFSSPFGQVFFYWMYHSLNLELVSTNPEMIVQVNKVKDIFAQTLGNPVARANNFKDKLIAADSGVLFTQESDALVPQTLTETGLFHPVDRQNRKDGTLVFLRSDLWEPEYEIIPIEGYKGFNEGLMNVILATKKESGQKFLLAACHGHSTKSEDGRLQITLVMEKFHQLSDGNLQLFIGTDANTKTEKDVELFEEHLHQLGLICTRPGPTTVKRRMVTAQHSKAGRFAIDQEDYLITLKPELGGQFKFSNVTVGFVEEMADPNQSLPNIHNPSDHYPVGATMVPF